MTQDPIDAGYLATETAVRSLNKITRPDRNIRERRDELRQKLTVVLETAAQDLILHAGNIRDLTATAHVYQNPDTLRSGTVVDRDGEQVTLTIRNSSTTDGGIDVAYISPERLPMKDARKNLIGRIRSGHKMHGTLVVTYSPSSADLFNPFQIRTFAALEAELLTGENKFTYAFGGLQPAINEYAIPQIGSANRPLEELSIGSFCGQSASQLADQILSDAINGVQDGPGKKAVQYIRRAAELLSGREPGLDLSLDRATENLYSTQAKLGVTRYQPSS